MFWSNTSDKYVNKLLLGKYMLEMYGKSNFHYYLIDQQWIDEYL